MLGSAAQLSTSLRPPPAFVFVLQLNGGECEQIWILTRDCRGCGSSCTVLISTLPVLPSGGGGPRYLRMHQILWKYLHSSWENICSAETDLLGNLMALQSHWRWTHGDNAAILTLCVSTVHVQCSPHKKLFLTFISNKSSRTIECNFLCFNCLLFPFEIIVRTLDTYLGFNFLLRPDDYLEAFPKEPR